MSLTKDMKHVIDIQGTLCLPTRIFFTKTGSSRYMSHLDLMRCMIRAMRRAGIPIWYTEGFNPHPFMTFALPLSLGISGLRESMDVRLTENMDFDEVRSRRNGARCEGIEVLSVGYPGEKATAIHSADYTVVMTVEGMTGVALCEKWEAYLSQERIVVQKKNKKKQLVDLDVKPHVLAYSLTPDGQAAALTIRLPAGGGLNINPRMLLDGFAEACGVRPARCDVTRTEIYTESGEVCR